MVYALCVAVGMILGIILWEKIGVGDVYKGRFKFKQAGRLNTQSNKVEAEIAPKKTRKERRIDKKQNKL